MSGTRRLAERVIVVTGGGRGIGRSLALACAHEGARVAVAARSRPAVERTAAEIEVATGMKCLGVVCDVAKAADIDALFTRAEKELGPVDGLVCAAGIYGPIGSFESNPIEEWVRAIDINLIGTARAIHRVLPGMKARKSGQVVLFSGGGVGALTNFSSYVSSKGAIWRLTETLGAELAPFGVSVNCIAPGAVNTQFLDELLAAGPEKVGQEIYERSLRQKEEGGASPEKAAELAVWLLSQESVGLTGRNLSALWDDYRGIADKAAVSRSDLYTMRRVVDMAGGTRAK